MKPSLRAFKPGFNKARITRAQSSLMAVQYVLISSTETKHAFKGGLILHCSPHH
jgi:hypothetical protein